MLRGATLPATEATSAGVFHSASRPVATTVFEFLIVASFFGRARFVEQKTIPARGSVGMAAEVCT